MACGFSEEFFIYLSKNTNKQPNDIKNLFDDYFCKQVKKLDVNEKPKKSNEEDDTKKFIKESSSKKKTEEHKCERIPRGKSESCGKNARNSIEINGEVQWYCGTKDSGCYHSILSLNNKKEKNEKIKKSVPEKQANPQKAADIKTKSLVHKIMKTDKITIKSIMVDDKKLYIDPKSRVLFHRDGVAYAMLDKDDKTISNLVDDKIRWLESCNVKIEQKKKDESSDESSSDDDSDEEELEEECSDEEELEEESSEDEE